MPAVWWLALGVLVLNDHALKGSGLLPGVITGKLSDFAGLIVAPVLACTAFRARSDRARAIWLAVVAIAFTAIKSSSALAAGAGAVLSVLGVRSRIWCDPTDLIALTVLPLALQLARRVQLGDGSIGRQWSRRIAVSAAALACVATSEDGPTGYELRPPFVINWTRKPLTVSVERSSVPCEPQDAGAPAPELEQESVVLEVPPAHIMPIGWPLELDSGAARCGRADVRVAGRRLRVAWDPSVAELRTESVYTESHDADAGTFEIVSGDQWAFDVGIAILGAADDPTFDVGERLREEAP